MATKYIVMKHYISPVDEVGKDRRRYEPRFFFDAEEAAHALCERLKRAATIWYSLVNQPPERQPPDYAAHLQNAEAVLRQMDPEATHDSMYSVEPSFEYEGPQDDVRPVLEALMAAFAQVPNPPQNGIEALYRLVRDAAG